MECAKMKCDSIESCRCYTLSSETNPNERQFCGYKKGRTLLPCNPGCCAGGCPGQCGGVDPREPYEIIEDSIVIEDPVQYAHAAIVLVIMLILLSTINA